MCGNGKHFRRRNQIKHRGWKAGGESGRCRVVYFGQNTGFAKGNEEKFDPFRIKRHQMFIKLLLCARLHSKHWGIYISEQKPHKIPFLVELALWRGETDDQPSGRVRAQLGVFEDATGRGGGWGGGGHASREGQGAARMAKRPH